MKRRNIVFLYLAIFLIVAAIFFFNIWELSFQVILATLLISALVSLAIGTIVLVAIYLIRKLTSNKA